MIDEIVERDIVVYGVNTGFGKLADVRIPHDELRELQLNLVRSHACGIGPPLSEAEVRAMMLLRANVLALGFSGIRFEVIELLCEMLNRRRSSGCPGKGFGRSKWRSRAACASRLDSDRRRRGVL